MTLKLRKVHHPKGDKNGYCGPSILSALTGMASGEGARLIRHVSGKASVKGTAHHHLVAALRLCGFTVHAPGPGCAPAHPEPDTLASWLRRTHGKRGGRVFLIVAGNHWLAVSGNRYVCGIAKDVVPLDHPKVKRRARVTYVREVRLPGALAIPAAARKRVSYVAKANNSARYRARKLQAQWGLEFEADDMGSGRGWWVYGPEGAYPNEDDDPCQGSHFCTSWSEVLECAEAYAEDLAKRGWEPAAKAA